MSTHHLIVTGAAEEGEVDDRDYAVECSDPSQCNGWIECLESDCQSGDEEDGEEIRHGKEHTYVYGYGWRLVLDGCPVVTFRDAWIDSAYDLDLPAGRYEVDDDWDDDTCYLGLVDPRAVTS